MKKIAAILLALTMLLLPGCTLFQPRDGGIDYKDKADALPEAQYIKYLAIAVAAENPEGGRVALSSAKSSKYNPVLKLYGSYLQESSLRTIPDKTYYQVRLHGCLKYGFCYITLSYNQLKHIETWEAESGKKVLYPLLAQNAFSFADDPNVWYKVSTTGKTKMMPVDDNGKLIPYSEDMVLSENFLRDESGRLVYFECSNPQNPTQADYRVRILLCSYFRYIYGRDPEYPKDYLKLQDLTK